MAMKSKAMNAHIRNRQARQAMASGNDGTSASTQSWKANSGASTGYYIDTDKTLAQLVTDIDIYTIQMWVKFNTLASLDYICSSAATLYGNQMTCYAAAADALRHRHGIDVTVGSLPDVTAWMHLVLRKNANDCIITVDNTTQNNTFATQNKTSTQTLEIFGPAQDGADGTPTRYADGFVTDFVVWDRLLTDGEVTTLYNSGTSVGNGSVQTADITLQYTFDQSGDSATGTINDISGNNYHGTVRQEATGNSSVLPTLEADSPS